MNKKTRLNRLHEKKALLKSRRSQNNTDVKKEPFPVAWSLGIGAFFIVVAVLNLVYTKRQVEEGLPYEKIVLLSCFIIPYLASLLWFVPKLYVGRALRKPFSIHSVFEFDHEKEALKLEDDTRKTLAQVIGGTILFSGLIFTYNTFVLNREGQITDRFSKAVAQLGDKDIAVKLGGLYALERISKDSPRDYAATLQIISAYVREKSPIPKINKANEKEEQKKDGAPLNNNPNEKVSTDIQTALTIVGRAITEQDTTYPEIDLSRANLRGAKLKNARLNGAGLENTDLSEVDLESAVLDSAKLNNSIIREANLNNSKLRRADLSGAQLIDVNLSSADLKGAIFKGTVFSNVNFIAAQLDDAYLYGANLKSCALTFEQLMKALIDEETVLPPNLEDRSRELLDASRIRAKSQPTPYPAMPY